jgi:hypothetical protein
MTNDCTKVNFKRKPTRLGIHQVSIFNLSADGWLRAPNKNPKTVSLWLKTSTKQDYLLWGETGHTLWPNFATEYEPVLWQISALVDLPDCLLELTKTGLGGTLLDGLLRNCAVYHIYLRAARQSEPSGRNLTSWLVYFFVFQIYPDPDSEKAIMGSVVYCIHHKEGCKWTGELRKLKVRNIVINLLRGIYKRVFRNLPSTTAATSVDNINAYETYIDITESLSQTWTPPPLRLTQFQVTQLQT